MSYIAAGGLIVGTVGSAISGQAQNRAIRRREDELDGRTGQRVNDLLRSLYGQSGVDFYNQAASPGGIQPGTQAAFDRAGGGPLIGQMQENARFANTRGGQMVRRFDNQTGALARAAGQQQGMVDQLSRGNEGLAASWGQGRGDIIRQDARSQLGTLNSQSRGALQASGLGNTSAVASQMGANSIGVNREMQRALQALAEGQIDRSMAARSQRVDVNQRMGEAQTQRNYQRESDRQGLTNMNLNRTLTMRQQPIDAQTQMLYSSVFNPQLGQTPSGPLPQSGLGQALGSLGGAAVGYGSYRNGMNDLEELFRRYSGGGGGGGGGFPVT